MLDLTTKADLQRLVDEGLEESLVLDYKASPALTRDGKGPDELCKDVTALANSAGGQLVYGVEEDKVTKKPSRVDEGVADPKITREWIEQILNSRVQPRMNGVRTTRIDMETGNFGYVISVPQTQTGPHQAPDGKYYKRFDLQSVPMRDYEIKDVMRRSSVPDLSVTLSFAQGSRQTLSFPTADKSQPFPLIVQIENRSPQPAFHVVIDIGIDIDLAVMHHGDFIPFQSDEMVERTTLKWIRWDMASPPGSPIFKEYPRLVSNNAITLVAPHSVLANHEILDLTVRVVTPGFTKQENWSIRPYASQLTLFGPDSEFTAKR
jgi:hypothetical protein